LYLFD